MNKKALLSIAGVALLALTLAGCASNTSPVTDPTESSDVWTDTPVVTSEDSYLAALHSLNNFYIENNTDSDLIALGYQVCRTLDTGATVYDLVEALVATGDYTGADAQEFAGSTIGAAISAFCPQYLSQLG